MPQAKLAGQLACPACQSAESVLSQVLPSVSRMAQALGVAEPELSEGNYRLMRCTFCTVEFANPMREPGPGFDRWLTDSGFAYPADRWEWKACKARIAQRASDGNQSLLVADLGSGDGGFLRSVLTVPSVRAVGMDHNADVVASCRSSGLEVFDGGLECLAAWRSGGVDMITMWHVVEHVADPFALLRQAQKLLRAGGEICFSVPLSPMSYEHAWPDPFNEPPHHLTRWNLNSLDALARGLEMTARYTLPRAKSMPLRVLRALTVQAMAGSVMRGRLLKARKLLDFLLRRAEALLQEIARQRRHLRHEGRVLPDVVLVTLRR